MNYDNLITQAEWQAIIVAIMAHNQKAVVKMLMQALARFSRENRLGHIDQLPPDQLYKKIMALDMGERDALAAVFAILEDR